MASSISYKKNAIISGFLGASASCIGKLALDPTSPIRSNTVRYCEQILNHYLEGSGKFMLQIVEFDQICPAISIIPRIAGLILMILMNAFMMSAFLDGMGESGSVVASALSTAANFSVSAAYGVLLFDETVGGIWLTGFLMILSGVWLLSTVNVTTIK